MARDAFQEQQRTTEAQTAKDKVIEIRSACLVIRAKAAELVALRDRWAARIATGEYDQADVDRINERMARLAALAAAVETYLA